MGREVVFILLSSFAAACAPGSVPNVTDPACAWAEQRPDDSLRAPSDACLMVRAERDVSAVRHELDTSCDAWARCLVLAPGEQARAASYKFAPGERGYVSNDVVPCDATCP
jgi:hypothetical protein